MFFGMGFQAPIGQGPTFDSYDPWGDGGGGYTGPAMTTNSGFDWSIIDKIGNAVSTTIGAWKGTAPQAGYSTLTAADVRAASVPLSNVPPATIPDAAGNFASSITKFATDNLGVLVLGLGAFMLFKRDPNKKG